MCVITQATLIFFKKNRITRVLTLNVSNEGDLGKCHEGRDRQAVKAECLPKLHCMRSQKASMKAGVVYCCLKQRWDGSKTVVESAATILYKCWLCAFLLRNSFFKLHYNLFLPSNLPSLHYFHNTAPS